MVKISLLTTKLHFPKARPDLVPRTRLVERLSAGLQGPLTLIAAPAGYGKTTLMSEWRAEVGLEFPSAWLSLEADDNDPVRFLSYLTLALDAIKAGLFDHLLPVIQSSPLPPIDTILQPIINDLDDIGQDFVFVRMIIMKFPIQSFMRWFDIFWATYLRGCIW